MAVALARLRMPLIYLGLAAIAVDSFLRDLPRWPLLGLLAVAFAVYLRLGTVRRPPVEVRVLRRPVEGKLAERYVPSVERARAELGLRPLVSLPEAVGRTARWYAPGVI